MVIGLAALGLIAGALAIVRSSGGGMKLTAFFADSGDLQSRGSVQMADVRIGSISRITLTPDFRSKGEMSVIRGVRIPKDIQAVLAETSLLGERFVNLVASGSPTQGPF